MDADRFTLYIQIFCLEIFVENKEKLLLSVFYSGRDTSILNNIKCAGLYIVLFNFGYIYINTYHNKIMSIKK